MAQFCWCELNCDGLLTVAPQRLFVEFGGKLLDHCQVTEIVPGDTVTVTTDRGLFTAKKLVITAGAWAPAILAKLGVQLPFKVL